MGKKPIRIGVIGCGIMASEYMESWLRRSPEEGYVFPVIADPAAASRERMLNLFRKAGVTEPAVLSDTSPESCARIAKDYSLDMAYIASPTAFHAPQAVAFLEQGAIDVLLEKPAAPTAAEIRTIVKAEQDSGRHISIGFNGSFCRGMRLLSAIVAGNTSSFQAHLALLRADSAEKAAEAEKLHIADFAEPVRVAGIIWENWLDLYRNHWKFQEGFIKDCGIHMLNAFYDVTGRKAATVNADLEAVDASDTGTIRGVMTGGTTYRLRFLGDLKENVCESRMRILFRSGATCELDIWGKWFKIFDAHGNRVIWERTAEENVDPLVFFRDYRDGKIENPNPVTRSLDLAELMEAITLSRQKAAPVTSRAA